MDIRVSTTNLRANLSEILDRVKFGGETSIIERFGTPTAALVSMADLGRLHRLDLDEVVDESKLGRGRLRLSQALATGLAWRRGQGKRRVADVVKEGRTK